MCAATPQKLQELQEQPEDGDESLGFMGSA